MPKLLADVTPLRISRDFRLLFGGQLVSFFGSQLTMVAVPLQVFEQTHSSLQVGLVSLGQMVPLILGSLVGGAVADAYDRRRLLLLTQVLLGCTSALLAFNAVLARPHVWPLYVITAAAAAISGLDNPARTAALPGVVPRDQLPAALALRQVQIQVGAVVGPAVAGLLLTGLGLASVYWIDTATFAVAFLAVAAMRPLRPEGGGTRAGLASVVEGLRYVRSNPLIASTFVIDINAMVFGMPRALFPALGLEHFHGTKSTVGLLYAAPGAGALVAAVFTGWVGSLRRHGRAVIVAVMVWGAAIAGFGLVPWLWAGLVLLGVAGAADVVSAVFRNTILQLTIPDALRGRLSATHIAVVTGGPRLGDVEAGGIAALAGAPFSVVSGGLACVLGALVVRWRYPQLDRYDASSDVHAPEPGATPG